MTMHSTAAHFFRRVDTAGLGLPGVAAATKYDGSPVLRLHGCFMAGMATHPTAEPGTLVVRMALDDREALLEDAPETYYLTDYYRPYPVVLARLAQIDDVALRDLLTLSWRLTLPKARRNGATNAVRRGRRAARG
jgi:hypothetical protein